MLGGARPKRPGMRSVAAGSGPRDWASPVLHSCNKGAAIGSPKTARLQTELCGSRSRVPTRNLRFPRCHPKSAEGACVPGREEASQPAAGFSPAMCTAPCH